MSAILGETFNFLDRYIIAVAIAAASGKALEPEVQDLANIAWARVESMPLDVGDVAEVVAEDVRLHDWGVTEASQTGFNEKRFDALLGATLNAPGIDELYRAWRRGKISPDDFIHGLRKARLETRWDAALQDLKDERLSPQEIALGIVRSVIADPDNLMVTQLDTSDSNVPQYTPLALNALQEAAASGFDRERLRGLVGEIGLPMSAQQAASALFRKIITPGAYNQAILEGDTRPEWAPFILEQARQIPSVVNFVENHLRGYSAETDMNEGAARHGMSAEDTAIIFQNAGRPLAIHQITTGLARGGQFQPQPSELTDPFEAAVHESDIKPAYYDLAIANRYTYPSAFVIRQLAQAHELTEQETEDTLLRLGWEPSFAKKVAMAWSGGTGTASKEATASDLLTLLDGDKATEPETLTALEALGYSPAEAKRKVDLIGARRVVSAKGTAITDIHKKYAALGIDADVAVNAITQLGVPKDSATAIVAAWAAAVTAVEPS